MAAIAGFCFPVMEKSTQAHRAVEGFDDLVFVVTGEDESAVVIKPQCSPVVGVEHHGLCYQLINDDDFVFCVAAESEAVDAKFLGLIPNKCPGIDLHRIR